MSDILIRDVPADVVAALDSLAKRMGLSRAEYIRRRLAQDAQSARVIVTERGLVHISNMTPLEVGYSAQAGDVARREFRVPPPAAMPVEYLTQAMEDRALEVQLPLADRGMHRGLSIPDLIIAATAALAGLTVLHVDNDFDTIAAVTDPPLESLS